MAIQLSQYYLLVNLSFPCLFESSPLLYTIFLNEFGFISIVCSVSLMMPNKSDNFSRDLCKMTQNLIER